MSIQRRLQICSHWLAGRRHGVSPLELARFASSSTCVVKARRHITRMTDAGEHLAVEIRGAPSPLFWPKGTDLFALYMVVSEMREPADWHYYEVPETRVGPEDVVADCGASEGIFSLFAAPRARHVYAIEPSPRWAPALQRTFAGVHNVTLVPAALGREVGEAYLAGGALDSALSASPDESGAGDRVPVETIDRLFHDQGRPLTYVKADLEGFELEMLAGAECTIGAYLPKIAITTYHRAHHADAIATFLRRIEPRYQVRLKGIEATWGAPLMLHAWVAGADGARTGGLARR